MRKQSATEMLNRSLLAAALSLLVALPAQGEGVAPIRLRVPTLGATTAPIVSSPGALTSSFQSPSSLASVPLLQPIPLLTPSVVTTPALFITPPVAAPMNLIAAPLNGGSVSPIAAVAGLQHLAGNLQQAGAAGQLTSFDLSQRFFDQSGSRGPPSLSGSGVSKSDGGVAPKLPPGVKRVTVDVIGSAEDIERVVPNGINSNELKSQLKRTVGKMAPYNIYTYHDALGGRFTAIDLSANPRLVSMIPELQIHEVRLIQKLQLWNKDLQVLIREDGKTPDLVVAGQVTELKSLIGRQVDLERLLNKANNQVLEHGRRHGLGHGALAVDLAEEDHVAVDYVSEALNRWQAKTPTAVIDQVLFFGGAERRMFRRGEDGRYSPEELGPDFSGGTSRPIKPSDIGRLQFMVRKGKLEAAHRTLHRLESGAGKKLEAHHPLSQVREGLEGERVYHKIGKLLSQRKLEAAVATWKQFVETHSPQAVAAIKPKIETALPLYDLPERINIAPVPDIARIAREIEEPPRILREKGIRATIAVYGSARILPEVEAQRQLDAVIDRVGSRPALEADRGELKEAKRAVAAAKYYTEAQRFGALVAAMGQGKIAIVTGGGPGIMEAANRGAFEAGGPSIGYNIVLPHEQRPNPYLTPGLSFDFENFSTRKMSLRHGAVALVYFPGGFGTMDELFDVLTLMQTGKMQRVPIVLLGHKDYWSQVLDFTEFSRLGLISEGDLSLFKFAETADQAWAAIAAGRPK